MRNMDNLLRPLIALGVGLLLGVGGHAGYQAVTAPPATKTASPASKAGVTDSAGSTSPGARSLGTAASERRMDESKAFAEGRAAASEDTETLLARVSAMSDGRERDDFVRGIFSTMAMKAPTEAMDMALQLADPHLQSLAVKALALEWAFDPSTLGSEGSLENAMLGAVVALASSNPEKASLLAQTNLEGRSQQFAMMAVAKQWAVTDPEGALAWMGTMKDGENGRLAMTVATSVADSDPQLAANYLDQIADERGRQWASSRVAESWYKKDAKAAVAWASNVSDPALKTRAVTSVASEWAENDPQGAIDWAQSLGDPEATNRAVGAASREWARKDPASAVSYASGLPAGEVRTAALSSVANGWARVDADAARAWAESLTVQEERDAAVRALRGGRGGRGR